MQQSTDPGKDLLLFGRARGRVEGVLLVAGKTSGKISAVVRIVVASHRDLVTGIELGRAAQGRQDAEGQLQPGRSRSRLGEGALEVVIAQKQDQSLPGRVERGPPHL